MVNLNVVSDPARDFLHLLVRVETLVNEDYVSVVLLVPDNSSNGLVESTCCLLTIPLLPSQLLDRVRLVVEVVLFHYRFRVYHKRIGNTHQHHRTSCIIRKVKTLTELTSADSEDNCTFATVNVCVVGRDDKLVVAGLSGFLVYSFYFLNLFYDFLVFPILVVPLQHVV